MCTYEYFIISVLYFSDTKSWQAMFPSFEFMNFVFALIVWSSRYPSVYWQTSKAFSLIFSIQMIANAIDLLLVFAGVSVIYKLQVVGQKLPLQVSVCVCVLPVKITFSINFQHCFRKCVNYLQIYTKFILFCVHFILTICILVTFLCSLPYRHYRCC